MRAVIAAAFWLLAIPVQGADKPRIEEAFRQLYQFDFPAAHTVLNHLIEGQPADPLPQAIRASAYLFEELHRLGILEGEFFTDDKKIIEKKKLKPDPNIRIELFRAVERADALATARVAANPNDADALFALCVTSGVVTDYTALVEKKQMRSLGTVKKSYAYARRLMKADPGYYDGYLSAGLTEYLVGSLPFFVRWFVRFDDVSGDKNAGMKYLKQVSDSGRYLRPFAKVLLAIVYMREKQPRESQRLLAELNAEFPRNPLFRKELDKVTDLLRRETLAR